MLSAVLALSVSILSAQKERVPDWIDTEIQYLITPQERSVYDKLTMDDERSRFIEDFWLRRDPDPRSAANEFREEFYGRIAYANEHFTAGMRGWKTDRGRVYILHGPPDRRDAHPTGGRYQRPPWQGGDTITTRPFEIWEYNRIEGIGEDIVIEFVDRTGTGHYVLEVDPNQKDVFYWRRGSMPLQRGFTRAKDSPFERIFTWSKILSPPPLRLPKLKELVTTQLSYGELPFRFATDRLKLADDTYLVPLTIELQNRNLVYSGRPGYYQAEVQLYGQFIGLSHQVVYEFDDVLLSQTGSRPLSELMQGRTMYQRTVPLSVGRYKVRLILKDVAGEKVGSAEAMIVISGARGELETSSLILADLIQPAGTNSQPGEPFVFGKLRVVPNFDSRFAPENQLGLYLEIYGLAKGSAGNGPEVEMTTRLIIPDGRTITLDNKLETAHLQGSSAAWSKAVPLGSFAKGRYRVEVEIVDRMAGNKVTLGRPFEVF